MKKMLSLILAFMLVLGLAANVVAEETTEEPQIVATGKIEGHKWTLYDDGNLLIVGNLLVSEYSVPWRNYAEQITRVTLQGAHFATRLLDNLPNLTTVHFPNSTGKVHGCFKNCPKFTAYTSEKEKDGEEFSCRDGYILRYETSLFQSPTGLSGKVVVPDYVINIWDHAFINCAYIEEVVFQEGLVSVGEGAFVHCTGLKTVTFPGSLRKLSGQIFDGCTGLESIYFTGDAPIEGMDAVNYGGLVFGDYNENRLPKDTRITANVYYPADNETWTEENRAKFGGLVTWIPYTPATPFRDVPRGAFYEEPVIWAVEKGITSGTSDTTFSPAASCNRAQAVTFLWAAAGKPEPTITEHSFVDVPKGSFCEKAVLWAVEKGITTGTDETHFSPLTVCNRATIVTFLYKAFNSPEVSAADNPFEDVPDESWYTVPALWAKENGITSGTDATHFSPASICNRAQIVTFLYGAYN